MFIFIFRSKILKHFLFSFPGTKTNKKLKIKILEMNKKMRAQLSRDVTFKLSFKAPIVSGSSNYSPKTAYNISKYTKDLVMG